MNKAQILAVLKEKFKINDPEHIWVDITFGYNQISTILPCDSVSVSLYDLEKYVNNDIDHNLEIGEKKTDADFVIENFTWMLRDAIKDIL